jgi:hypothetical protein
MQSCLLKYEWVITGKKLNNYLSQSVTSTSLVFQSADITFKTNLSQGYLSFKKSLVDIHHFKSTPFTESIISQVLSHAFSAGEPGSMAF